jgi:glycosyltransferase involved in cell wall biosynthesis
MRPRILFVDQSGALGGGELSLLDIAKHYYKTCKVALLSDGPFRTLLEGAAVPVTVVPAVRGLTGINRERGGAREVWAMPAVMRLAWRLAGLARDYDLIYANTQKAMILAALAGRLARTPVIWHLRDILSPDHFGREHRWVAVRLANLCVSRVIANSRATAGAFIAAGGDPARVTVIYNGIDPTPFALVSAERPLPLQASLGLGGEPIIGAFGRLSPWKGQHVLVDALKLLPGVHALVVGAALYGEDAYADALRRRVEAMSLADRIHFLGFRSDVPDLMSLATIIVHTSVAPEPFGRVLVEGMLAKRPVVAARAGGVPEIIEDGISGVLVPPADPSALAHELARLLNDRARASRIAANGHARARRHFSLDAMVGRIEQEVDSVLARSAKVRSGPRIEAKRRMEPGEII